ncbi:MAG: hypothetical protein ACI884_002233 [Ulvibacter sp.]|jgi:hypothetical protein
MVAILFKKASVCLQTSLIFICMIVTSQISAQKITGPDLVKKTIQYHDPNNNWSHFKGKLFIEMKMPEGSQRLSEVSIDLPQQYFKLSSLKNDNQIEHVVNKDNYSFNLNGKTEFSEEEVKTYNLTDTRARFMRNYYTFLYGLPMKLADPGTIIDPVVQKKEFMGKEYLVLKVKYEEGIGKDSWYFYFDPKTYAMKIYQFYHDEAKNDGEYITLSQQEVYSGIKIPKIRTWYVNKDGSLLATDKLTKVSEL